MRGFTLPDHGTKSYAGKEDIIDAIQTGILSSKVVSYRYADAKGRARAGYLAPLAVRGFGYLHEAMLPQEGVTRLDPSETRGFCGGDVTTIASFGFRAMEGCDD